MGAGACVVADDGSTPATQDESEKLEHKRRLNHFKMLDIKMKGALDRGGVEQMIEAMLDNDSAIASKRDELLSGVSAILDCGYKTELEFLEILDVYNEVCTGIALRELCVVKFRELDAEGVGSIGDEQVQALVACLLEELGRRGFDARRTEAIRSKFCVSFSSFYEGKITVGEFQELFHDISLELILLQSVSDKFMQIDLNGNGLLEDAEMLVLVDWVLHSYHPLGAMLTKEEVLDMTQSIMRQCAKKKISLAVASRFITDAIEDRHLHEASRRKFAELDVDSSGYLSKHEVLTLAEWVVKKSYLTEPIEEVQRRLLEQMDVNGDEQLDAQEFCNLFMDTSRMVKLLNKARAKFLEFDVDNSGFICRQEIRQLCDWALAELHGGRSISEADRDTYAGITMRMIDKDGDNTISQKEFAHYFDELCKLLERRRKYESLQTPTCDPSPLR